ncbi:DeoR/GlpR family DNA-binding transcription regulator [Bacillus solitudinis]|uniref:DeoR/GlpR family DNA-binding transcription regulator n=1 Tax=Bacillus solitudinis TaxID=2014074 RepID=UPI000C23C038|nr:DeoR/GlpR family DNA-binding transcription regulator [Bacillus solitudinis]
MLVSERHKKIVEIVNEKDSIRVSDLSKYFKLTEETIRRDLEKLEGESKLNRSHGGAVRIPAQVESPFFEREIINIKEKEEVAKEAVKFICSHDCIMLDASSTAWYMAKIIPDIPLTVLTNSMKVVMELSKREHITVMTTGGTLLAKSLSFVGPLAEQGLMQYHLNKAFLSCHGIHSKRGISESNEQQAMFKKRAIDISDQVFLLADHSKFEINSFAHISSLASVDWMITDSSTTKEQLTSYKALIPSSSKPSCLST